MSYLKRVATLIVDYPSEYRFVALGCLAFGFILGAVIF